jgi:hypothetical protein
VSPRFKIDSWLIPDETVLLFGIRYEPGPDDLRTDPSKTYTYVVMKVGGLWYVSGTGKSPQAAGWGAVERWLERDGREVAWVKAVTETTTLWPVVTPGSVKTMRPAPSWVDTSQ